MSRTNRANQTQMKIHPGLKKQRREAARGDDKRRTVTCSIFIIPDKQIRFGCFCFSFTFN